MCYDIKSTLESHLKRAELLGDKDGYQKVLEELWSYLSDIERQQYHVSGFSHPKLAIQTSNDFHSLLIAEWGLIPHWVKDATTAEEIWNKTLNARGETIFDKPSFRDAAASKRCVIIADGFYEYHYYNGKAYPFFVHDADKGYLIIAGLWSEYLDKETGEIKTTFTVVTTKAKGIISKLHNNPKLKEPRLPVILKEDDIPIWISGSQSDLMELINSVDESSLSAYPVSKLRGKDYIGNRPEISNPHQYENLEYNFD